MRKIAQIFVAFSEKLNFNTENAWDITFEDEYTRCTKEIADSHPRLGGILGNDLNLYVAFNMQSPDRTLKIEHAIGINNGLKSFLK